MSDPNRQDINDLLKRVAHLEGCQVRYDDSVDEIKGMIKALGKDFKTMAKSHQEIREVVFNGLRDKVAHVESEVVEVRSALSHRPGAKQITFRRLLETALMGLILMGGLTLIAMFLAGRIDPDDIANVLRAWRGE